MTKIIPAILTKNIADFEHQLERIQGLADWVQVDIMDNVFVNNSSISLDQMLTVELAKQFKIEAHLMVQEPANYFLQCHKANVQRVIFHLEAGDAASVLAKAREFNFQKGIALNPETPIEKVVPFLQDLDVVLLMSVHPGFGGQEFIGQTLDKIKELKKLSPEIKIEVDGGINTDNIAAISQAGADYLVLGSGLFGAENIEGQFKDLQSKIT